MDIDSENITTQKIAASVHKWTIAKDIIVLLAKLGTVIACVYIIMSQLVLLAEKNPDAINSVALVVKNLSVHNIVLYIVAASGVGYGYLERKGKKRAIQKMAQYQYKLEEKDPYRGSSNLTSQGDSPKPRQRRKGARK